MAIALTLKEDFLPTGLFPQFGIAVALFIGYFACIGAIFWCGVRVLKNIEDKQLLK